jgi:hypothetical protein
MADSAATRTVVVVMRSGERRRIETVTGVGVSSGDGVFCGVRRRDSAVGVSNSAERVKRTRPLL